MQDGAVELQRKQQTLSALVNKHQAPTPRYGELFEHAHEPSTAKVRSMRLKLPS